jgi:hypothetical protein
MLGSSAVDGVRGVDYGASADEGWAAISGGEDDLVVCLLSGLGLTRDTEDDGATPSGRDGFFLKLILVIF